MNKVPTLKTTSSIIDENHLKIDIAIENGNQDLFGIAFHLVFKNDDWELLNYEKGPAINANKLQIFFLTHERKTPLHEIIFGTSLNNDDRGRISNGKLVSFIVKIKNPEHSSFTLTNQFIKMLPEVKNNHKISNQTETIKNIKKSEIFEEQAITLPKITIEPKYMNQALPIQSILPVHIVLGAIFILLIAITFLWLRPQYKKK